MLIIRKQLKQLRKRFEIGIHDIMVTQRSWVRLFSNDVNTHLEQLYKDHIEQREAKPQR